MTTSAVDSKFYADPTALSGLKRDAKAATPDALRETARQFESLFTTMMLKSMRQASPKDEMFGSDQQDFYQDMFDQQMSVQLSKGKGLGLADMLVKQLMQNAATDNPESAVQQPGTAAAAPATPPTASATSWPPRDRDEFVRAIQPAANEVAKRLGVDPSVVIAHAALETGWGQSVPATADGRPGFNLFGIKAGSSWKGAAAQSGTQEFAAGRMQNVSASFRSYDSPEQSMADYANLLQNNPRYAAALGTGSNVDAFAQALQRGGYATDPDYASKLSAVARDLKSRLSRPITPSAV